MAMLAATRGLAERAVLLALATSGLRRAEALSLNWTEVDLEARQLTVRGKGDKDRPVVIFRDLLAALHALRAHQGLPYDGPVFRGRQGRSLQKSTLQRWLNHWLAVADLRSDGHNTFTLHSLRRFAAKQWLDNGLNIRQVQLLLGHEDLQTTMLYLDYTAEDLHAAAEGVDFGLGTTASRDG
jgi:integrase/recombinase XerC